MSSKRKTVVLVEGLASGTERFAEPFDSDDLQIPAAAPQHLSRELKQLKAHYENFPEDLPSRRNTRGRQAGTLAESDSERTDSMNGDNADIGFAFLTSILPEINKGQSQQTQPNQEQIYIPIIDAIEYALSTSAGPEPTTLAEALERPDADKYLAAAIEEVKAHLDNGTWEVVRLPHGK
ncbi:hypothetical protein FRC14_004320 [Serendipita sp. 396]|nr:hypothetical protein FRC14_004320 [Serendipita sp. 396]